MKNVNGSVVQVVREVGSIFESIWQAMKDSGPCCGIRFNQKAGLPTQSNPILCSCYKMRM
jgi:hypothetical protein